MLLIIRFKQSCFEPDFSAGLQTVDFLDSLTRFVFGVESSEFEFLCRWLADEWLGRFGDSEVERERLFEFWKKYTMNKYFYYYFFDLETKDSKASINLFLSGLFLPKWS